MSGFPVFKLSNCVYELNLKDLKEVSNLNPVLIHTHISIIVRTCRVHTGMYGVPGGSVSVPARYQPYLLALAFKAFLQWIILESEH
eukprot:4613135-Pleurochrysis_carterae.AAC.1